MSTKKKESNPKAVRGLAYFRHGDFAKVQPSETATKVESGWAVYDAPNQQKPVRILNQTWRTL